jgi:hypothetical protein
MQTGQEILEVHTDPCVTVIALIATKLAITQQIVVNISCTKFHAHQTKNIEHRAKFVTKLHQNWPRNTEVGVEVHLHL